MNKKINLILLLLITISMLLISCGKNNNSNKSNDSEHTETLDPSVEIGTPISVSYFVDNSVYGYLEGETSQSISYGNSRTSKVTAIARTGYKFSSWSDGVTSAVRENESPSTDTKLVAYFELETKELPILYIMTENYADIVSKDTYINANLWVYNTDEEYCLENLPMQIRGRGNYTWDSTFNRDPMYNKRPYRIKLSEQQKLCGVGEGKNRDWVLLADHCDQSLLRNNIVYTAASWMENILWQPSVQSVEVYLNGQYNGVYLLCEQVEVNPNKVNVSEDLSNIEIGFLVMFSNYTDLGTFESFEVDGYKYEIKNNFSEIDELAFEQRLYIEDYVRSCWNAVRSGNQDKICELINIDSVIETYIIHEVFKNLDTGHDNFYMSKDIDGKLYFGPVWDFDQCAGNADCDVDNYENIRGGDTQPWYAQLLEHGWFKKLLQNKWNELKAVYIDKIPETIIDTAEDGYNSYCRNFEKWQIFGYKINRETYVRQFTTYKEHYEYFAEFMTKRIAWLDSYWNDPVFTYDLTDVFEGNGTFDSPYIISNSEAFYLFTQSLLNGDSFAGEYFLQTADIDMSSYKNYSGAGASATFAGFYNGNGYTITAHISGNDGCVFPYVTGTVYNVTTKGSINNSGNAGGIARSVRTGGAIINCISYMSLSSGSNAGGITSSNQPGATIANCFFGGEIVSASSGSPICVWYDGREGSFILNIYVDGIRNDTENINIQKDEMGLRPSTIEKQMSDVMTGNISELFWYISSSLDPSDLCEWEYDGELKLISN